MILRNARNIFSYNLPTGTLSSVLNLPGYCFKDKFCVKILLCKQYFSPLNTFMRNGKDLDPDPKPDPDLWLRDPDLGGPKKLSPTLVTVPVHYHRYTITRISVQALYKTSKWNFRISWRSCEKLKNSRTRTHFTGSESGYISQKHGSADPDPDPDLHQNVMDPRHWLIRICPVWNRNTAGEMQSWNF